MRNSTVDYLQLKANNLALLRDDLAAGRTAFSGLPPIVALHTSEYCNLACVMCERGIRPGRFKLPRLALEKVAAELFPTAQKILAGGNLGEPMFGDFDLTVELARRYGTKIDLVTNGSLLSGRRFSEIRDVLNRLNISVDCHVPEIYEKIRVGGNYDVLSRHLREIAAIRRDSPDDVHFTLSAIAMRSTAEHLPDFVRFAKDCGADAVEIQVLRHFSNWVLAEEIIADTAERQREDRRGGRPPIFGQTPPSDDILRLHDSICRAAWDARINVAFGDSGASPIRFDDRAPKIPDVPIETGICSAVGLNFAVFPNGDVYPCCHPTDHLFGNVMTTSCVEIWNSRVAQNLRRAHFAKRRTAYCSGCIKAPYLDGGDRPIAAGESLARFAVRDLKSLAIKIRRRLAGDRVH